MSGKVSNEYHRAWRAANPGKVSAAQRRYYAKHGPAVVSLSKNHGLSMAEARDAIANRPSECEICGRTAKLYYDHDHSTLAHRGWLCNRCNTALGLVEDAELLEAAQSYLRKLVLGG